MFISKLKEKNLKLRLLFEHLKIQKAVCKMSVYRKLFLVKKCVNIGTYHLFSAAQPQFYIIIFKNSKIE